VELPLLLQRSLIKHTHPLQSINDPNGDHLDSESLGYLAEHLRDLDRRDEISSLVEHIAFHIVPMLLVKQTLLPEGGKGDGAVFL
jgi:hypothetical protein